ncbi:hypothetical protein CWI36_1107p0010 [Hamiltosporidium magnivora]|uniref:Uncharacterized protein n=1 Tax=Hamiltosporidium magnivora TaxID=148818 RepID=A0A4Q9L4M1_9MICR|nr:hypothetical protein CWI36_1107p0010 [Hamiltosporidium magnivora]
MNVEAYIQSIVLKKTVETISFDRRRGLESGLNAEESWERVSMGVIMRSEMHEEPIPPLKEAKTEEDAPLISQGGTTLEEPINNINEESDLEEETIVVKEILYDKNTMLDFKFITALYCLSNSAIATSSPDEKEAGLKNSFNFTILCADAPTEATNDSKKFGFYNLLKRSYDKAVKNNLKIVLSDKNAK